MELTPEYLAQAEANAKELELLRATLAQLKAHVGLVDEPVADTQGFPKIVYRAQDNPKAGQLDHPGWDAKKVADKVAYEAALDAGFQDAPGAFVYADATSAPIVVKKPGKK